MQKRPRRPFCVLRSTFFVFLAVAAGCSDRGITTPAPGSTPAATGWFTDRAVETGLDFVHFNGMSGEFYYPEIMPPGVALSDNDGDVDVVVGNDSGPVRLLISNVGNRKHWVGLRLVVALQDGSVGRPFQGRQMRDMVGARVGITRGDGLTLWRRARADGSYGSASDPRVLAGMGDSSAAPTVRVIWPDGRRKSGKACRLTGYTTPLKEGDAK